MAQRGVAALTDAELLAILLRTGGRNCSAVDIAREILAECESLRHLSTYSFERMTTVKGVGTAKAATLLAAFEAGRRSMAAGSDSDTVITDARSAVEVMAPILCNLDHEECWVMFLGRTNRVISKERLSTGGVAATTIDVKMVVRRAVEKLASSIILIHNHPGGNPAPGASDRRQTESLRKAAQMLDIALLDHIIVAGNQYYSFSEEEFRRR